MNIADKMRERYWLLEKRKEKLRRFTSSGDVVYKGGIASRFYPNLNYSKKADDSLKKIINQQKLIYKDLSKYRFSLK